MSSPDGVHLLPGVANSLAALQEQYRLIVVTNQSGIARGFFSEADLHEINARLLATLEDHDVRLDAIYYCPHHPTEGMAQYRLDCDYRKPKSGMISAAVGEFGINVSHSFTIGDSLRDLEAGRQAGTKTILISNSESIGQRPPFVDFSVTSINEAAKIIAASSG